MPWNRLGACLGLDSPQIMSSDLSVNPYGSWVAGAAWQPAVDDLAHERQARQGVPDGMDMLGMPCAADEVLDESRQRKPALIDLACAHVRNRSVQLEQSPLQVAIASRAVPRLPEKVGGGGAKRVVYGSQGRRGFSHRLRERVAEGWPRGRSLPMCIDDGSSGG